jgi:hypothetical protein
MDVSGEEKNIQPLPGTEPRSLDFPAPNLHYGENYIMRSLTICTLHPILFR